MRRVFETIEYCLCFVALHVLYCYAECYTTAAFLFMLYFLEVIFWHLWADVKVSLIVLSIYSFYPALVSLLGCCLACVS